MVTTYGFAGMRDYDGNVSFAPNMPRYVDELSFPLTIRGQCLRVSMTRHEATYLLEKGSHLEITHQGKRISLQQGLPVTCMIKPRKGRPKPESLSASV